MFRVSLDRTLTNLYSFSGFDGQGPAAGLVRGSDGNFYGTTRLGGTNSCNCGTIFRISPSGRLTTLHNFTGSDGAQPNHAPLVQASDGNFYGTTQAGGTNYAGTVFCISPDGAFTNLFSFTGTTDGSTPYAGLVQGSDGNFYGTTGYGGNTNVNHGNGWGVVFRISIPLNPPANQVSAVQAIGNDVAFTIPSVAGETYQLQFATDLVSGNWSNVDGVCVSNSIGAALTVTNFGGAAGTQGFYRFAITP